MLGQAACQWDTGPTVASVGTETWTLPQQISRTPGYLGDAVQGRAEAYLCCVASGRAARRRARSCPGTESASPSLPAPGRPRAPGRPSHPPLSESWQMVAVTLMSQAVAPPRTGLACAFSGLRHMGSTFSAGTSHPVPGGSSHWWRYPMWQD